MSVLSRAIGLWRRGGAQWHHYLARQLCTLGPGAVVYDPSLVINADGRRGDIVLGAHTHMRGELFTFPGGRISLGDYCYVGANSRIWARDRVSIGDRVLIAHNVTILDSLTHPLDPVARHGQYKAIISTGHPRDVELGARPVTIHEDAWIACNCVIMRGVTIGAGAVIGAASVVTKAVPPRALVVGNPARVLRILSDEDRNLVLTAASADTTAL